MVKYDSSFHGPKSHQPHVRPTASAVQGGNGDTGSGAGIPRDENCLRNQG